MKHLVFTILFFALSLLPVISQEYSKHSLGGIVGPFKMGISYKANVSHTFAITNDIYFGGLDLFAVYPYVSNGNVYQRFGFFTGLFYTEYNLQFLYESSKHKEKGWYFGGGPKIGIYYNPDIASSIAGINPAYFEHQLTVGGSICFGYIWHISDVPLDISIDSRPSICAYLDTKNNSHTMMLFEMPLSITLRKRF